MVPVTREQFIVWLREQTSAQVHQTPEVVGLLWKLEHRDTFAPFNMPPDEEGAAKIKMIGPCLTDTELILACLKPTDRQNLRKVEQHYLHCRSCACRHDVYYLGARYAKQ